MAGTKSIRPAIGFSRWTHDAVYLRGMKVRTDMTGNPDYPYPPVSMAVLETALDIYRDAMAESLHGDNRALAARNSQREVVVSILRQLGIYAATNCNDNPAIFVTSGFDAVSNTFVPPQPLPQPTIRQIRHGNISGQLLVSITPIKKAIRYDLRYAQLDGPPDTWTTKIVHSTKPATAIDGLRPGTIYAFQVSAFGRAGHTDWSDSAICMCT